MQGYDNDGRPTFICWEGTRQKVKTWSFHCPYCRTVHTHSAGEGHRVAHCHEGSPFRNGGYFLAGLRK